jgi:hypothetical protein
LLIGVQATGIPRPTSCGLYSPIAENPDIGKVRKQVVAHIGKAKDREHAFVLAKRRGLICSVSGCGREWVVSDEGRPETIAGHKFRKVWRKCQEHYDAKRRGERIYGFPYMPELYDPDDEPA